VGLGRDEPAVVVIAPLEQYFRLWCAVLADRALGKVGHATALGAVDDESEFGMWKILEHIEVALAVAGDHDRAVAVAGDQKTIDGTGFAWSVGLIIP
jgi:hypothetical protein